LEGFNGFWLDGTDIGDKSGSSVGDVNGDGFDDILIAALPGGRGWQIGSRRNLRRLRATVCMGWFCGAVDRLG